MTRQRCQKWLVVWTNVREGARRVLKGECGARERRLVETVIEGLTVIIEGFAYEIEGWDETPESENAPPPKVTVKKITNFHEVRDGQGINEGE